MSKYVSYNENNELNGFYSKDVHGENIPENTISITETKWQEILENGSDNYRIDLSLKKVVEYIKPLEERILELKANKIKEFNQHAKQELTKLDWKVLRHIEQKELQIQTSLTENEYQELLQNKRSIRDKVNNLETIINTTTTVEELTEVTW